MNIDTYIKERLEDQINWYDKKSQWNQKRFKFLRISEMIISALVPTIITFLEKFYFVKYITAMFGSGLVVIIGVQSLYKFQENWLEYRMVAETLKHEKYLFETRTGTYDVDDNHAFKLLVERVESIASHENINWSQINNSVTKKKEK